MKLSLQDDTCSVCPSAKAAGASTAVCTLGKALEVHIETLLYCNTARVCWSARPSPEGAAGVCYLISPTYDARHTSPWPPEGPLHQAISERSAAAELLHGIE